MGYYIRVLATSDAPIKEQELIESLPTAPPCKLLVASKDGTGWTELTLLHAAGPEIALIERDLVLPGSLGEAELGEFVDEIQECRPQSAVRWLSNYLPRVKAIYAFQLLSGTDVDDGWAAVHALQTYIWGNRGGILQADREGFSNEAGSHVLWQFSETVSGPYKMAVLDDTGTWTAFEMDLGDRRQRQSFFEGKVPAGAKLV